jgi:DNA-binding CsgD family transcriptional regulator
LNTGPIWHPEGVATLDPKLAEAVVDGASDVDEPRDAFAAVSSRLRRLVPFDASVWMSTDPASGLPTAPTRAENMDERSRFTAEDCLRIWEGEFLTADVNLYSDLARASAPAGGLSLATGGHPARSPRYREVLGGRGFGDELRAVLRIDGRPWGLVALFRDEDRPAFDGEEVGLVAGLSRPLAELLRELSRRVTPPRAGERGPGLMVFAADGELISVNDDARAWLDELPRDFADAVDLEARPPIFVMAALSRARAVAEERAGGVARARMRSRAGRWLVCHASCLRHADGSLGNTALVIEPAKASEVAPIIVQAYELTPREEEITQLISHGLGTAEIASRLYLSPHTVRDYVKAIFEKVGVSSRGELVAKLFAEHYFPIHLDPAGHQVVSDA